MDNTDRICQKVVNFVAVLRAYSDWAVKCRPRLTRLALRAKKRRTRKKNLRRLTREYCREVVRNGQK